MTYTDKEIVKQIQLLESKYEDIDLQGSLIQQADRILRDKYFNILIARYGRYEANKLVDEIQK